MGLQAKINVKFVSNKIHLLESDTPFPVCFIHWSWLEHCMSPTCLIIRIIETCRFCG